MMVSEKDRTIFPYILPTMIWFSVFIGCTALGPYLFNADGDLGRHLTLGKYIFDSQSIPIRDIFSHTMAGQPLSPHEWLAAVLFQFAHSLDGLSGVVLFTAAILSTVFWLITYQVYRITRSTPITLLLVVVGIAGSRIHWLARPHIFTFVFLFLWIQLLHSVLPFGKKWVLSILLMLVWVNTHGAFITGYVYLGVMIIGIWVDHYRFKVKARRTFRSIQECLLILITSLLISLVNPSGIEIWQTILGFLSSRYLVSHTVEYMPPVLYQAGVVPFSLLVLISGAVIAVRWKWMATEKMMLLVLFAVFGITSGRNIPLFILISLPILAEQAIQIFPRFRFPLDRRYEPIKPDSSRVTLMRILTILISQMVIGCLLGGLIFQLLPGLAARNTYDKTRFPVEAINWLEQHPQKGKVFNEFGWGGYLLYRLWPEQTVFIDGQTDFYGEKLTREYEIIANTFPGWEDLIKEYQIDLVILPDHSRLIEQLRTDPDWNILYEDSTALIMRKGIAE